MPDEARIAKQHDTPAAARANRTSLGMKPRFSRPV
jgi:hypothetical protein